MAEDLAAVVARLDTLLRQCGVATATAVPRGQGRPARALPVCAWLEESLRHPAACAVEFCTRLRAAAAQLSWQQNASYAGAPFLDRYGYCELAGPNGHLVDPQRSLGLLLLGPETDYPAHAHPARETYLLLCGGANWKVGADLWRWRAAGEVVRHPAGAPHAMRTATAPLLAAYLWEDHLDVPARLTDQEQRSA